MPTEIWTDGSCIGNPGPGGWAVLVVYPEGKEEVITGGTSYTTNNRMELQAAIEAMKVMQNDTAAVIYSDSKYVIKGFNEWLPKWQKKGFKKNADLWKEAARLATGKEITWTWVRGHDTNENNCLVDQLAQAESAKARDGLCL